MGDISILEMEGGGRIGRGGRGREKEKGGEREELEGTVFILIHRGT